MSGSVFEVYCPIVTVTYFEDRGLSGASTLGLASWIRIIDRAGAMPERCQSAARWDNRDGNVAEIYSGALQLAVVICRQGLEMESRASEALARRGNCARSNC